MIELNAKGARPDGDMHEVVVKLNGVPRVGDEISVWNGREEVYVEVAKVVWPSWSYDHLPDDQQAPELWLVREEFLSDEEWADVFTAIKEERRP